MLLRISLLRTYDRVWTFLLEANRDIYHYRAIDHREIWTLTDPLCGMELWTVRRLAGLVSEPPLNVVVRT